MNYSQEIALTSQHKNTYSRSHDEESLISTNRSSSHSKAHVYASPIKKRRYGNAWVFLWRNGQPLITIGPHWWLFLLAFIVLEGMGIVVYSFLEVTKLADYKNYALALIIWEGFIYALTALKNPGIVLPNEFLEDEDQEANYSMSKCNKCNIMRDHTTVHCHDCNVCIQGMDHHCPWTGKCIGKGNLWPFYAFIGSTAIYFTGLVLMISGNPIMYKTS